MQLLSYHSWHPTHSYDVYNTRDNIKLHMYMCIQVICLPSTFVYRQYYAAMWLPCEIFPWEECFYLLGYMWYPLSLPPQGFCVLFDTIGSCCCQGCLQFFNTSFPSTKPRLSLTTYFQYAKFVVKCELIADLILCQFTFNKQTLVVKINGLFTFLYQIL